MLDILNSTSSHATAEACCSLLFKHYCHYVQVRYFNRVFRSNNAVLSENPVSNSEGGVIYISHCARVIITYRVVLYMTIQWMPLGPAYGGHSHMSLPLEGKLYE